MTPEQIQQAAQALVEKHGAEKALKNMNHLLEKDCLIDYDLYEDADTIPFHDRKRFIAAVCMLAARAQERELCRNIIGKYATCDWDYAACDAEIRNPKEDTSVPE